MVGAVGATAVLSGRGWAANSAGLAPGSFIWQGSLAPAGPVLVTYGADDELVRVYRAGVLIGISTCRTANGLGARDAWGVFAIDATGRAARKSGPAWSGSALCSSSASAAVRSWPVVLLPDDFAALLQAEWESNGSVVAIGTGVTAGRPLTGAMLLPEGVSLVSTRTVDTAPDRPAMPDVASPANLVVSTRDRAVVVRRPGRPDIAGTIAVRGEGPVRGDFLLSLVELGKSTDATRWLAVELSAGAGPIDEAIGRISLEGSRVSPLKLASLLSPGSTILVTDGPLTRPGRQQRPQLLLATRETAAATQPRHPQPRARSAPRPVPSSFAELRPLKFFKDY